MVRTHVAGLGFSPNPGSQTKEAPSGRNEIEIGFRLIKRTLKQFFYQKIKITLRFLNNIIGKHVFCIFLLFWGVILMNLLAGDSKLIMQT